MAEQDWLNGSTRDAQPYSGEAHSPQPGVRHELRPLSTGEILDRTFFLYRSNFWLYVGLASIAAGVNVLASIGRLSFIHFARIPATAPSAGLVGSLFTLVGSLLYLAVYSVTHAATVSAVSSIYLGQQTSMGKALDDVKGHWFRYCLIAVWQGWSAFWVFSLLVVPVFTFTAVTGLKNMSGLIAVLIFPAIGGAVYGVVAYIRNSLAVPAAVIENLTVPDAMRRSKQLAAGTKGRIFLLLLLLFALTMVASALQFPFALLLLRSRSAEHILAQVISLFIAFLTSALIGPVASIGLCLFYFDERIRKEAFDIEFLMDSSLRSPGTDSGSAAAELA